jgi:hypothetical protein
VRRSLPIVENTDLELSGTEIDQDMEFELPTDLYLPTYLEQAVSN